MPLDAPRSRTVVTPVSSVRRAFAAESSPVATPEAPNDTATRDAPLEAVVTWVQEVASMGADELEAFEQKILQKWDRASLIPVRRVIDQRRRELAGT